MRYVVECEYGPVADFATSQEAHAFCDEQNAIDGEGTYWVLRETTISIY